ncbi:MAG: hemophilus virulence surface antigen [Rickettsiaceae bacterium]|jgi:hypothetical protein|nr:hemophilus virulence surface antigen [Rickettsiaceae bacterium]
MKTYNIKQLKEDEVAFSYTPFFQHASVERLDENWEGSCNVASHQWIYNKARNGEEKFLQTISYKITNPSLPHPVIFGDNNPEGIDIVAVQKSFSPSHLLKAKPDGSEYKREDIAGQVIRIEYPDESRDYGASLANFIGSEKYHFGVIRVPVEGLLKPTAHAVAFAKMNDKTAFFDPNYGEIVFEKFEDFKKWFVAETRQEGCLYYITSLYKRAKFEDLFPIQISDQLALEEIVGEKEGEYDGKRMVEILLKKQKARRAERCNTDYCAVISFSADKYICPQEIVQDPKFKANEVDYYAGQDNVPVVKFQEIEVVAEDSAQRDKEELFLEQAEVDDKKVEEDKGMAGFTYHLNSSIPRPMPKLQPNQVVLNQQEIPDPEMNSKTKKDNSWQRLCGDNVDIDKQK